MSSTRSSVAPQRWASAPAARRSEPTLSGTAGTSARIVRGTGGMPLLLGLPVPARGDASGFVRMVRALCCAAAALALLCSPADAAAAPCAHLRAGWPPHVVEARQWVATRHGDVSFAVRTEGRLYGWRTRRTVPT